MWDRLLDLFRNTPLPDDEQTVAPDVQLMSGQPSQSSGRMEGPSTHIGYNYLKGMDGENEDSSKNLRRFINLNRLLRGDYNGKITATDAEPEGDLRGEDSE